MSLDISNILKDWKFIPGQLSVRKIRGSDDRDRIQMRLDLGLLQMEVEGRPDGERPMGCATFLEYCESELSKHRHGEGTDAGFQLDADACEQLRAEAGMYYHRFLSAFVLDEFELVERDTRHNIRLLDFCSRYAADDTDRLLMEQYRPYVLMMNARARAQLALASDRPKTAMTTVQRAMRAIRECYANLEDEQGLEQCGELAVLEALAADIRQRLPIDPAGTLRKALHTALREERYEEAAQLRDQLRTMGWEH